LWRQDPLSGFIPGLGRLLISYEVEEWLENALKRENEIRFVICAGNTGEYVEMYNLPICFKKKLKSHIYWEKRLHNKGIASKATKLTFGMLK
jgi:RimJ/RimL family protein N-acetyltransferase